MTAPKAPLRGDWHEHPDGLCAAPACERRASWGLVLERLVIGLCDEHARNAAGAHELGVPMAVAGGRYLEAPPPPRPLVFGGAQLRAALAAAAAHPGPGRASTRGRRS